MTDPVVLSFRFVSLNPFSNEGLNNGQHFYQYQQNEPQITDHKIYHNIYW